MKNSATKIIRTKELILKKGVVTNFTPNNLGKASSTVIATLLTTMTILS